MSDYVQDVQQETRNGVPCVVLTLAAYRARVEREAEMLEALREIHKLWCCPAPRTLCDWSARCDVMADFARGAIAKAEGRDK